MKVFAFFIKRNMGSIKLWVAFAMAFALCMFGLKTAYAQNPANGIEASGITIPEDARVVVVEPDNFPQEVGRLNETIEQEIAVDPNTIFELQRDAVYWLFGPIKNPDFRLHLRAQEGDGHPPIVRESFLFGVEWQWGIEAIGDVIVEGIMFIGAAEDGYLTEIMRNFGDDTYIIIDNCWLVSSRNVHLNTYGERNRIYFTNNIIWNIGGVEDQWGRVLETRGTPEELIYFENNTIYNSGHSFIRNSGAVANHMHINHNTVMNVSQYFRVGEVQSMEIKNNIFRNVYTIGEHETELGRAFIEIRTQPPGFDEHERELIVRNNNIGYLDEEFFPIIQARDEHHEDSKVSKAPNVSRRYMDPDNDLPLVIYEDNFEEGIAFANPPTIDNYVDWTAYWMVFRDGVPIEDPLQQYDQHWHRMYDRWFEISHDPVPDSYSIDVVRDFTYSSEYASFTAAEDGFPLGDLNWFPELKKQWEEGIPVSVEEPETIPTDFKIVGSYPNPFNPATTIVYELATKELITMEVYNILGQRVEILDIGEQSPGRYEVTFDASDLTSGIYIIRIQMGNESRTHPVTLIK